MTDNEIVKALECCNNCDCGNCPCLTEDGCKDIDYSVVLDLINRLQAENEKLAMDIDAKQIVAEAEIVRNAKAEAYKECIEKVKKKAIDYIEFGDADEELYFIELCDNLLKELVGEEK